MGLSFVLVGCCSGSGFRAILGVLDLQGWAPKMWDTVFREA